MGSPTSLDDWQTPLAPLADSQTLLAGLGFNTVAKTAHMSIMLLRSRAFLWACCGACHRACYNIRHNFPQVLPYSLPQGVSFLSIFPHHSSFSFFFFCVPFSLPIFQAFHILRSNFRVALLLIAVIRSFPAETESRRNVDWKIINQSINQSIS